MSNNAATKVGSGGGLVTSVGVSMPSEFNVTGSPITGAGTIAVTKANESANKVFAGPTSGGAAAPTFRSLVAADLPTTAAAISSITNATSPATLNMNTVGTLDWFLPNGVASNPYRAQSGFAVHSKQLGGWIKNSFDWLSGGTISPTVTTGGAVGIAFTTQSTDDMANALSGVNPNLVLVRSGSGTPTGYGYRFLVPAFKASHTLKFDVGINSVTVTITCTMLDGSGATQSTTLDAGASGTYVQKEFTVSYNASTDNALMAVTVIVTHNYGGSFQDCGFAGAYVA